MSDYFDPECLGEGYCMKDPEGILSVSHHPDCPRFNGGGGRSASASLPPSLDYLIEQLETTAEQCKGGDGSNNALRKNGRGEGLRIAKLMLQKAWPAIRAQVDLPSAVEAERLRAGCKAMRERLLVALATCPNADLSDFDQGQEQAWSDAADNLAEILGWPKCPECEVFAETGVCPDCDEVAGEAPAQPSELWARLTRLLADFEESERLCRSRADELRELDYADRADVYESVARRFRELLGLPPKEDR